MSQIYQEFTIVPEDTVEQRITKLYMGIISVGEDLYCKGSHLSEIKKYLDDIELRVRQMKIDLAEIKELRKCLSADGKCEKEAMARAMEHK